MKRRVAIGFLVAVLTLVVGTLLALRTQWAGDRLCEIAEAKVSRAAGLPIALGTCRIEPFKLEVSARNVRVGPPGAPVFSADAVRARLAPVQAFGSQVHLDELELVRPRVNATLPARQPGARGTPSPCPPPLLAQFELHRLDVTDGALDVALPGGEKVHAGRLDVHTHLLGHRGLEELSSRRAAGVRVRVEDARIEAAGRKVEAREADLEGSLRLDFTRADVSALHVVAEGASVSLSGVVKNLCKPELELQANVAATLPALLGLAGKPDLPAAGRVEVDARISGPLDALAASGHARVEDGKILHFEPGDAAVDFALAHGELRLDRVEVPIGSGVAVASGKILLKKGLPVTAEVDARDVEFARLLSRLGLHGAFVMMKLAVKGQVAGTLWPLALSGGAGADATSFRVLDHSWESWEPGQPVALEAKKGRVDLQVRIARDAVRVESGKVRVGEGVLGVTGELRTDPAKGFDLALDGTVDLSELRKVAGIRWAGMATLHGNVSALPYADPHIRGTIAAHDFHFLDLDLGDVTGDAAFRLFTLDLTHLRGVKGETSYAGEMELDLAKKPVQMVSSSFSAAGRLRDLFDIALPWQPNVKYARDVLDARVSVAGEASGPLPWVNADFDARLGEGALAGHAFEAGRFRGRIVDGREVAVEQMELTRGPAVAKGTGTVGMERPFPWDIDAEFHGVRLGELDMPGGPYAGSVSGTARLSGSFEHPTARFAASGDGVAVHGIPIGACEAGGKLEDKRLSLTGTTEGAAFTASADLEGDMPFTARADVDADDVTRFIPGGPPAGLTAAVQGVATADGLLADVSNARAALRFTRVHGGYGDFKVDNKEPVSIVVDHGRVDVESFTLRGANTEFALSGSREAGGRLDLNATGALDLRLLAGAAPALADPRGQLTVEAAISGTAAEPLLVGTGRVRGAAFRVRGVPLVFAGMDGELSFSQNRVLFDDVAGTLNGGRAQMRGEVELASFLPSKLRIEGELDEVPMRIPESIPSVVSGQLSAFGSPDALTLSGKLHVLRARYTEKVDLEKSLLEFRRNHGMIARVFDKSGEWLRFDIGLLVDGDVRVENDLVKGAVKGEVTVTGNVGAVGMMGTLALADGSKAYFRGNEFNLTHAVVDFNEKHRVHASFDVHGDTAVRDYRVYMHYFGTLEEPQLQLTSNPALSQQDIVTLLSLGFTTHDAAAGSGVGGAATAAAAQALFSVSGLDDQVKRFLPRDGIFKDFSVRMTSAYSEGTGQVEPRAEFESKMLDDRLRLRYQAPLSGARGQRAQAELKLNSHSALQYQWDNDNPDVVTGGDHGFDLKLRWEWSD